MSAQSKIDRRTILKAAAYGSVLQPLGWGNLAFAAPNQGSTLTVALPNMPNTIDPINQANHDSMLLNQTVFENLVEYDIDSKLKPQLAVALPTISADAKQYTFDLRDDVFFQNGQKMTAEDVKYSFDYLLNPDNKALRRGAFARLSSVEVLSPTKVRVNLSEPYTPWLNFLTKFMGIFPKGSREANPPDFFRLGPVGMGTGVGIFEEWKTNDYVSFRRNPNYWRKGLPKWERLVVKAIPEDATRISYLMRGEVDIISTPPPREFNRLKSTKGIKGEARPTFTGWLAINCHNGKPPFDDVNFRKAISAAIDRKTLAEKVCFGFLEPSTMVIPASGWWYNKEADQENAYNPEKAKAWLAKSKYPNGATFEMTISSDPWMMNVKDSAIFIQSQLAPLNIKPVIKVVETSVMIDALLKGEHTSTLLLNVSTGEPTYMVQNYYTPGNTMTKAVSYGSSDITDILRKINAESSQEKQKPLFAELARILARDVPSIGLGFATAASLWRDRVKNFRVSQGITMNVKEVEI